MLTKLFLIFFIIYSTQSQDKTKGKGKNRAVEESRSIHRRPDKVHKTGASNSNVASEEPKSSYQHFTLDLNKLPEELYDESSYESYQSHIHAYENQYANPFSNWKSAQNNILDQFNQQNVLYDRDTKYVQVFAEQDASYQDHNEEEEEEEDELCTHCLLDFANDEVYGPNEIKILNDQICKFCNSTMGSSEEDLVNHCKLCDIISQQRPAEFKYKCYECGRNVKKRDNMRSHTRKHTGLKPFKCRICDSVFKTTTALVKHVRQLHKHLINNDFTDPRLKEQVCKLCNMTLGRDEDTLINHCKTCDKITDRPAEYKFTCYECQKHFKYRDGLKIHIRKHTNERPYPCDHCNKAFKERATLTKHKARKHKINPNQE